MYLLTTIRYVIIMLTFENTTCIWYYYVLTLLIYDLWIKIITVWNNGRKCLSKIFTKTENHGMIIKKKQKNPMCHCGLKMKKMLWIEHFFTDFSPVIYMLFVLNLGVIKWWNWRRSWSVIYQNLEFITLIYTVVNSDDCLINGSSPNLLFYNA